MADLGNIKKLYKASATFNAPEKFTVKEIKFSKLLLSPDMSHEFRKKNPCAFHVIYMFTDNILNAIAFEECSYNAFFPW